MNKEFIELLKSQVSLVDVVSARMRLRRSGNDWFGLCPFHKEKTGSFKVDGTKGFFYCFGCGAGGDAIKFVMDFDKISFQEAVERLAQQFGLQLPQKQNVQISDPFKHLYDILSIAKNYFIDSLKNAEIARKYLNLRKITEESIEKFQLGYAPDSSELYNLLKSKGYVDTDLVRTGLFVKPSYGNTLINRYRGRLMFPIIDALGKCVGFGGRILDKSDKAKYINSPETEIYKKSNHLYGYHLAKRGKSRQIVITEGYLDVISLHQAGFDGAVAPLGTSISETQINMCWKICNNPVISLDGDSAGIKASYRWIDRILTCLETGKSFKFAKLPQGADPDLLVFNGQVSIIEDAIAHAIPLSQWLWEGAFSLYPSETPEQKADIIKTLIDKINNIKNTSLKKLYLQDIKKREYLLLKNRKKIVSTENLRSPISAKEKIEKIFIVTLLNHPYIIDKVAEDVVRLEFSNIQMRELKDRILQYYTEIGSGNMEKFAEFANNMLAENLVNLKDVNLHAEFVDKDVSDEEAIQGWNRLMMKYLSKPQVNNDLQKVISSLESSFSEDDWQKLKALKAEVISERTKEQGL